MSFYGRWIAACAAGELIGIGTAAVAAIGFQHWIGEPQTMGTRLLALAAFAAVGAVEGTALAGLQWLVLRQRLPRLPALEWIGATVGLAVVGWLVGMTPSLFFSQEANVQAAPPQQEPGLGFVLPIAALIGAGAGFCFGFAQWLVLRSYAERAARWIWIQVPAWALAMAAIFLGAALPGSDASGWLVAFFGASGGVLAGMLLGAITGLVAQDLRPQVDGESTYRRQGRQR